MTKKNKRPEVRFAVTRGPSFPEAIALMINCDPIEFECGRKKFSGRLVRCEPQRGDRGHADASFFVLLARPFKTRMYQNRVINAVWLHYGRDESPSYMVEANELDAIAPDVSEV